MTRRGVLALLACGAGLAAAVPASAATTPLGTQVRVSVTGADGDAGLDAFSPSAAYNPAADQYLVAWSADTGAGDDEIFGRLLDGSGTPLGAQFRISDMGPDGDPDFDVQVPAVAYNTRHDEYMVVWYGDDDAGPLVDDEFEVFAQRLDATGAQRGVNDRRISDMGPNGDPDFAARNPAIAYNATSDEYLVVWNGDDGSGPLVDNEREIFAQRLSGTGAQVGANDRRISDMGPNGDATFAAELPAVAHDPVANQYMVAWVGDDDRAPLVNDEDEIFVQRLGANGAEEGPNDRRVSDTGPDGNQSFGANLPSLAFNAAAGEYLVAWEGDDDTGDKVSAGEEIFVQRLASTGAQVGVNDRRISRMGPDGDTRFRANTPRVAVGAGGAEYLVAFDGTDDGPGLLNGGFEVFAQRLAPDGAEIGDDDVRVSTMGVDGDPLSDGLAASVAFGSRRGEYLIAWEGDTGVPPLVDDKSEIHARRFGAGAATASAVCKVLPPVPPPTPGDPSDIRLTTGQLLINQRIDQAAIRRANGVQAWIDGGIEGRDLCQGSLGQAELATGVTSDLAGPAVALAAPAPRPIVVAPAKPADASGITLTTRQLLINQRISQSAIRRLNALKARMDGGLTGGDVDDGTLTQPAFVPGLRILAAPPPATPPAASTTDIAPAKPGDPSQIRLSTTQLLINQRISQAAVRRANELIARIEDGLLAGDIRDAGLTRLDLAPGVAP